ncbi:MAG: PAS domain-containing protein [Planctomycetota bacterium]|jgi:PAS domain-containing protein
MKEKNQTEQIVCEMVGQGICDCIGDGISIQDTDFMILYQNKTHINTLGDHVGEKCYKAYERKENVCEGCPVAMVFEDGEVHTTERSTPTDRGLIYVEITASPLRDPTREIIAGIEVVRDITERKKTEKALIEKMEELVKHYKISGRIYKVDEITKEIEELTSKLKGDKK